MKQKNLIMGTVKSYSWKKLEPFVRTLKQTGFSGDIVFFVCEVPKKTKKKLIEEGIKIIEFDNKTHLNMFNEQTKNSFKKIGINEGGPLNSYRHFLYSEYLKRYGKNYENVMLTDLGDIVFQKNPFSFQINNKIHFFLMGIKIKKTKEKKRISNAHGKNFVKKIENKQSICAGTVIGIKKEIINYLHLMKKNLTLVESDQPTQNYLIYSNKLSNIKIHNNGDIVLTTSSKEIFPKYASIRNNLVYNKRGKIINVLHNYDRILELSNLFEGNKKEGIINTLKSKESLRVFLSGIKNVAYSIPLIGRFIRKIYINYLR